MHFIPTTVQCLTVRHSRIRVKTNLLKNNVDSKIWRKFLDILYYTFFKNCAPYEIFSKMTGERGQGYQYIRVDFWWDVIVQSRNIHVVASRSNAISYFYFVLLT
jgi:hypothetical protein